MRSRLLLVSLVATLLSLGSFQHNPFLGRWDMTGTDAKGEKFVYWLEVTVEPGREGKLTGRFLNRVASVYPLTEIAINGDELVFTVGQERDGSKAIAHLRSRDGQLVGKIEGRESSVDLVGRPVPHWPTSNRDLTAAPKLGQPVELFDGRSMTNWGVQYKDQPSGWSVVDGSMTNSRHANNIVSQQRFRDFKIHAEYKLEHDSNSGIYLRGRYEMQVLDDYGKPPDIHGHMSIYSRVAPLVNASKPPGEWQVVDATIVHDHVTVILNGQLVQKDVRIDGITGGALDSDEAADGPIMLQGDHGKVYFRRVTVTPIID